MAVNKKTVYLKRSIQFIAGDDPARAIALEQLFVTGKQRPSRGIFGRRRGPRRDASYYEDAAMVASNTAALLRGDQVFYITEASGPRSGRVTMATAKVANFKITTGEFRLCTREEIERDAAESEARAK